MDELILFGKWPWYKVTYKNKIKNIRQQFSDLKISKQNVMLNCFVGWNDCYNGSYSYMY